MNALAVESRWLEVRPECRKAAGEKEPVCRLFSVQQV